jgi:choline/glycine/proline betaine transport protein
VSAIAMLGLTGFAVAAGARTEPAFVAGEGLVAARFGWWIALVPTVLLIGLLAVAVSRLGQTRLGPRRERPAHGRWSWFALVLGAGTGGSVLLVGTAQPLAELQATGGDGAAARAALLDAFLRWGLHGWAAVIVVALGVALVAHRAGRPASLREALRPLLGPRVDGALGDVAEVLAVLAAVVGVGGATGSVLLALT